MNTKSWEVERMEKDVNEDIKKDERCHNSERKGHNQLKVIRTFVHDHER